MTTLTDTQRAILDAAARRQNGIAAPPTNLPPAPRGAVASAVKAGLPEVVDGAEVWSVRPASAGRAQRPDDRQAHRRDHPALTALPPPAAQSRDTGGKAGC